MGKIVFGGACQHVLDPEYSQAACGRGPTEGHGRDGGDRRWATTLSTEAGRAHRRRRRPHERLLFNCVPAICVRIGRRSSAYAGQREAFDKVRTHGDRLRAARGAR